jgi:hypothetical protein
MPMTPEERIAELLRALPAPPQGWIERDAQFRALVQADLEEALRGEGVEPTPAVVALLRRRLER